MRTPGTSSTAPRPEVAAPWAGGNRILAHLPAVELAALSDSLTACEVESGQVLYEQRGAVEHVYFPETAVMSLLNRMQDGSVVEVGTVGNESAVGLGLFLGANSSIQETIAQIPGRVRRMPAAAFMVAVAQLPEFRRIVAACMNGFFTQVSQTAACNRLHGIEQRCARWLLLTHDRVGGADSFPVTHQFLSLMLGVRRAGVTEAVGALARARLVTSSAGRVTILDRRGLEKACCECYAIVRQTSGAPFDDGAKVVGVKKKKPGGF